MMMNFPTVTAISEQLVLFEGMFQIQWEEEVKNILMVDAVLMKWMKTETVIMETFWKNNSDNNGSNNNKGFDTDSDHGRWLYTRRNC